MGQCPICTGEWIHEGFRLASGNDGIVPTYGGQAVADPWKDESGHGYYSHRYEDRDWRESRDYEERAYKEKYRSGGCEIEREWDDGKYKEEIECDHAPTPSAYIYLY